MGAGSKDMGCAPVIEILVKEGQMEAVESLIGDGEGGLGVWGLAAGGQVGRWLGAARGHGGRHESGGVSCCCCWLAGAGELGLGVDGFLELLGVGCTRFGLNTRSRR